MSCWPGLPATAASICLKSGPASPETIAGFFGRPYWEVAVESSVPSSAVTSPTPISGAWPTRPMPPSAIPPWFRCGRSAPSQFVLELFHGPTLAFKDVAMQLISRLMDHVLAKRAQRTTIVVATSGDTGGAAVDAFAGLDNVDLIVLFPHGRISEVQRRMMTTIGRGQHSCAGDRGHLRRLPGDREGAVQPSQLPRSGRAVGRQFDQLGARRGPSGLLLHLRGRARRAGAAVDFTVPTGNFGDIFAGYVAKRMGLPVRALRIAANVNDILPRTLKTGIYEVREVHATASPSMDIQVSSNFERLLFEAGGRDADTVRRLMGSLTQSGRSVPPDAMLAAIRAEFDAGRADETETAPPSAPPGARPANSSIRTPRWRSRSPIATSPRAGFPISCCRPRTPPSFLKPWRRPAACDRNCRPGSTD